MVDMEEKEVAIVKKEKNLNKIIKESYSTYLKSEKKKRIKKIYYI